MGLLTKKIDSFKKWLKKVFSDKQLQYPKHILPSFNKKLITTDISECVLIRHFHEIPQVPILEGPSKIINQVYLLHPRSNVSDLSTNLLGVFGYDEGKIKILGDDFHYYNSSCAPDFEPNIPKFQKDFILDNQRLFWHVLVDDIQRLQIEYPSVNKNSKSFTAVCKVFHTPMKWNFWHFSIRWLISEKDSTPFYLDNLENNKQKKYINKIVSEARSFLSMNATTENKFHNRELAEKEYLK